MHNYTYIRCHHFVSILGCLSCNFMITAHCHLQDVVSNIPLLISSSANQHKVFISLQVKACMGTQLINNHKYAWFFLRSLVAHVHFIFTFFPTKHMFFFATHILIACSYCWLEPVKTLANRSKDEEVWGGELDHDPWLNKMYLWQILMFSSVNF